MRVMDGIRLVREVLQDRSRPTEARWGLVLDTIRETLDELLALNDFESAKALRVQNSLRALYDEASRFIPPQRRRRTISEPQPADWIKTVLAQARLYFWIAAAERAANLRDDPDFHAFIRDTWDRPLWTDSQTAAYRAMLADTDNASPITAETVAGAAEHCRRVLERARVQAQYWQAARRR